MMGGKNKHWLMSKTEQCVTALHWDVSVCSRIKAQGELSLTGLKGDSLVIFTHPIVKLCFRTVIEDVPAVVRSDMGLFRYEKQMIINQQTPYPSFSHMLEDVASA